MPGTTQKPSVDQIILGLIRRVERLERRVGTPSAHASADFWEQVGTTMQVDTSAFAGSVTQLILGLSPAPGAPTHGVYVEEDGPTVADKSLIIDSEGAIAWRSGNGLASYNADADTDINSWGDLRLVSNGRDIVIDAQRNVSFNAATGVVIVTLPTSDPGISGALWDDAGTVKVSP